jgi:hypothetical protein
VPAAAAGVTVAGSVTVLPTTAGVSVEDAFTVVLVGVAPEIVKDTGGEVDGP